MSTALDLGSHAFRVLRRRGDHLVGRQCRSVCSVFADTPTHRQLLDQSRISYAACDGALVLIGTAAVELANVFGVPQQELLSGGMVPRQDPVQRQVIATLVSALLGPPAAAREVCAFIQPGQVLAARDDRRKSLEFFSRLIQLQGFTPLPISAGHALGYATLSDVGFTGITLSLGHGACELSVLRQGQPMIEWSIPRGGRWLDEELARHLHLVQHDPQGQLWLDVNQATRFRERATTALVTPKDPAEQALGELADHWLAGLVTELLRGLDDAALALRGNRPVPLVVAGGLALWPGVVESLAERLRKQKLPIPISEIRRCSASPYILARGALIHAELVQAESSDHAAA